MDLKELLLQLEQHDIITVFRHIHPDCDAFGAQFGMATWLKNQYPNKQIYAVGKETINQGHFPDEDEVSDEIIQQSLAIVVDSSVPHRVDDERYQTAKYVIKIDHHPNVEPFGDLQIIETKAAATCEILTDIMYEVDPKSITKEVAYYLYQGLLTDSLCYRTSNTTANTLKCGSILAQTGLNIPEMNRILFDHSFKEFEIANYIREHVQVVDEDFAYEILSQAELKTFGLEPHEARTYIDELGQVKEFKIWCIFTELEDEDELYDGSIRSKTIPINQIANAFHGGGHANASGVNHLTRQEVNDLIAELRRAIAHE